MSLEGKVALITGGARGLGRAYVLHLARLGADVIIADIDLQAAREYGEELTAETVEAEVVNLGRRGVGIAVDVTDRQAVDALVAEGLDAFGRIDILVNNAGGNLRSHEEQAASLAAEDHYRYIMDINLTATIHCCQAVSAAMKEAQSGKIINVASQAGLWSGRDGGGMPYKVAKAGIIHYTRVLAAELGLMASTSTASPGSNFVVPRRGPGPQQRGIASAPRAANSPPPLRHARGLR